ncbi:MAG: DUF4160 domain-containing protein [Helicobacteraceae bacterium]|nr:DUF4160 domain-containing protein [Helicobacteraceae bacterium]
MPEISRFYGIKIAMYPDDHNPPHFHVAYSGSKAVIGINNFALLQGSLPPKALSLVVEWAVLHKEELLEDWELSINLQSPKKIEPLV